MILYLERCLLGRLLCVVDLHLERGRGQRSWEDPWAGWRDWVGNNKDQLLWVDQSLLVPHWGKADHAPGWEALPRVWSSIPWKEESLLGTGGNCWRIDRSQQSPTRLQNPPTANSFLIRGKAVDTLESIFWVISNTFMCLNSLIGTSSQPTSKTRALPTQAFWSEGKSYQCSQSRLLGILRQIFIRDIK